MYKKILVPLDGSKQAEEVLPLVSTLAEANNAEIVLLHVTEYPYEIYSMCDEYPPADPELAKTILNKKADIYRAGKDYLEQITSALVATGEKVTIEICEGPVVTAILGAIERLHVDLVAMATCGQSKCNRCMMGAVADRVLREAPVSVILIRPATKSPSLSLSSMHRVTLSV